MIAKEAENVIRKWIESNPGEVFESSPDSAVRRSWGMCGVQCSVAEFDAEIRCYGHRPREVSPGEYVIAFPKPRTPLA